MNESASKQILKGLLIAGVIALAATSPYFALSLSQNINKVLRNKKQSSRKESRYFKSAFYYLKRKGYLIVEKKNHRIYIRLTEKGKKKAKKFQIDDLKIKKQKKWDGKWRIVIFDIPQITRLTRDALRGKLKELGFYRLQQSVWICPFPCQKEVDLLRQFFGLDPKELILIEGKIAGDQKLRKIFKLA